MPPTVPRPQQLTAKLEDKIVYNEKFILLSFELTQPFRMEFLSGQYVSIKVDEKGTRRPYSICSSPSIDHGFEIMVDITPDGVGCRYLNSLEPGDEIHIIAPMGFFVFPEQLEEEIVMIATGSGIAPFRSMLFDLLQMRKYAGDIALHWGIRHAEHLIWLDEFEELSTSFPNFKLHPVVSRPLPNWTLSRGRVTDVLKNTKLNPEAGYYLCGGTAMVDEVTEILKQADVSASTIHHEQFF